MVLQLDPTGAPTRRSSLQAGAKEEAYINWEEAAEEPREMTETTQTTTCQRSSELLTDTTTGAANPHHSNQAI